VEIVWEERGAGARPLVLLHGFTGFRHDFATHMEALGEVGRTLAPDLPGHGDSGRHEDASRYTLDALAADVAAWLGEVAEGPVDLLGHSMGGMIALRVARARPARVASLVLMDTSASPLAHVQRDLLETASRLAREAGTRALAAVLRARAGDDPERSPHDRRVEREWGEAAFWQWRTARVEATDPVAYEVLGAQMLDAPSLEARLPEIAAPTLVLVGADDTAFLAPSRLLADRLPHARYVEVPDAAHQPQHENPPAWRRALLEHLRTVRS
jgi:pimeloyl-ACP methyl ester carboxylesterase